MGSADEPVRSGPYRYSSKWPSGGGTTLPSCGFKREELAAGGRAYRTRHQHRHQHLRLRRYPICDAARLLRRICGGYCHQRRWWNRIRHCKERWQSLDPYCSNCFPSSWRSSPLFGIVRKCFAIHKKGRTERASSASTSTRKTANGRVQREKCSPSSCQNRLHPSRPAGS